MRPSSSSSASRAGSRPEITHVSTPAARSAAGRCSSTPAGRSAASSSTVSRAIGSPAGGQRAVEAGDRLQQDEALGADGAGHPRGDRVRGDGPRLGEGVALRQQRGRQQDRDDTGARRRELHAPLRTRDEVGERPAELVHRQDRHPVRGLRPQTEAAVVLADRVRELRAAGHDEQRMARAQLRDRRAQRAQRAGAGLTPEPAADLDDGQHDACSAGGRQVGERRRGRRVALCRAPRQLDHGAAEALRHRAGEERPGPERHDRRRAREARAHPPRRRLDLADLRGVEIGGDRLDLGGLELLRVGADEPRDALARALHGRCPPVRRRARVVRGLQMPEDQVHVGADREQLGGDRAPAPADGDARGDRRQVGAQRAGVDELARRSAGRGRCDPRRRRGRPRSGSRRRSCCRRRASAHPRAARRPRGRSPPSWRRRRRAAGPAPRQGSRARPRS